VTASEIYYKVDSRRLTLGEYWRFSKKRVLVFLVLCLKKLFGSAVDFKHGVVRITSLTRLESAQIPKDVQDALAPSIERCAKLQADFQFLYTVPSLAATEGYAAAFLYDNGKIIPQVLFARSLRRGSTKVRNTFACITRLSDGRLLSTVDQAQQWNAPSWSMVEYMPGAGVEAVFERHCERVKNLSGVKAMETAPDQLEKVIVEYSQRTADDKIQKGVYVPMTSDEVAKLKAFVESQKC
jgi:hypothetical protein